MQINPKFFVNIDSYIDVITMYPLLKNIQCFDKYRTLVS